jgi:MoxR-like ATPase
MSEWRIYRKDGTPHDDIDRLPPPPPWRTYIGEVPEPVKNRNSVEVAMTRERVRGPEFRATDEEVDLVNAALYLRRPLLITGRPGTGKSSLPYSVAWQLKLGEVLRWPITSRSTLQEGLYRYDALGRLQDANINRSSLPDPRDVGRYIRLGPLGTALYPTDRPRVLLIDEIDKSDVDLPNDLLNVFEEGEFEIPELSRLPAEIGMVDVMPHDGRTADDSVPVAQGRVVCKAFPFIALTSNGERDFPPAFLRRCLRLDIPVPDRDKLADVVRAHLADVDEGETARLIEQFVAEVSRGGSLATDQLLNAIYLVTRPVPMPMHVRESIERVLLRSLDLASS